VIKDVLDGIRAVGKGVDNIELPDPKAVVPVDDVAEEKEDDDEE